MERTGTSDESALRRSVKVERYADVLAHVVHFGTERTEEVVRRFGFTVDRWRAIDAAWTADLAEAIRRNQQDLALRFSATLAKRRRRLAQDQPSLDAVGDAPAGPPEPGGPAASQAAPQVALPSFMATSRAVERGGASDVAPSVAAVPTPIAVAVTARAETSEPAGEKPITQAMPARSAAGDPLPFAGGAGPETALRAAIEHAEIVQGPRPSRGLDLGVTAPTEADRIAAIARRIMPFQPGAGGRDSDAAPPPEGAGQGQDATGGLTLERHASLHVELGLHPDLAAQTLRRYGLTSEQHARLDEVWQAKIAQEPAVRASWEAACARYRAWLLRNRP